MDANLLVRNFKAKLIHDIETSGLPAGVLLYILKDTESEIRGIYEQHCKKAEVNEKSQNMEG